MAAVRTMLRYVRIGAFIGVATVSIGLVIFLIKPYLPWDVLAQDRRNLRWTGVLIACLIVVELQLWRTISNSASRWLDKRNTARNQPNHYRQGL